MVGGDPRNHSRRLVLSGQISTRCCLVGLRTCLLPAWTRACFAGGGDPSSPLRCPGRNLGSLVTGLFQDGLRVPRGVTWEERGQGFCSCMQTSFLKHSLSVFWVPGRWGMAAETREEPVWLDGVRKGKLGKCRM